MDLHGLLLYNTSAAAQSASSSWNGWTQCIFDIAIGNLDICFGAYDTSERRSMMGRAVALHNDDILLLGIINDKGLNFLEVMWAPFMPFAPSLWLLIIGISLFMGCSIQMMASEKSAS